MHGQEKSSSYYDLLYDFGVLLYGCTPTLIFFYFLYKPVTPILTIKVLIIRPYLEKSMQRSRRMKRREILGVSWRTMFGPDQGLPRSDWSFHQIPQYRWLHNVIGNPHRIRQGSAANSCQESRPHSILTGRHAGVGPTPALWDVLRIPVEPSPKSSLLCIPLHRCDQSRHRQIQAVPPHHLHQCSSDRVDCVPNQASRISSRRFQPLVARQLRRRLLQPLHPPLQEPHHHRAHLTQPVLHLRQMSSL